MSDFDAVRDLSLSDFFEREFGVKAKRTGSTIRFHVCPECGEGPTDSVRLAIRSDDRHWKCHRCGESGDIVDAAVKMWGLSVRDTVFRLVGKSSFKDAPVKKRAVRPVEEMEKEDAERAKHLRQALILIHKAAQSNMDDEGCLDYLCIERNLPIDLVREAQRRNMLCFLPSDPVKAKSFLLEAVGEELLKASGLWKEGSKVPAIMYRPIVFLMPGMHSAEFRIIGNAEEGQPKSIRYGSSPWPYVWRNGEANRGMIVEGFIDMLSSVALGYQGHVIALPGCNNWEPEWFSKIAETLHIQQWVIAMDQDGEEEDGFQINAELKQRDPERYAALLKDLKLKNPGQYWAIRLKETLDEMHHKYIHRKPPEHSDINDILRAKKAA